MDIAEMFREHELRVFGYFTRMVADRETAADLTQETFLRALRIAHRFRADSTTSTWLLGIARNIYLEWARRYQSQDHLDSFEQPGAEESVSQALDVERTLARISPADREVLVLRFVLDLPGEEVARLLGVSHDSVRQRVARAKEVFRDVWGTT
jgi:RNA polymerase sigma-70 factor (ECF subfamily)